MYGAAMDCAPDRAVPPRHGGDGAAYQYQANYHASDEGSAQLRDPRSSCKRSRLREPLDLPIPDFKIDANYVGEFPAKRSKSLDLDTRIDLLIRSKALAGVLPIFSEQDESNSSCDSDESFLRSDKHQPKVENICHLPEDEELPLHLSFDDPDVPLSRPPSPFLSRATYLFWFNKAIELKQQAKAQEQALLELAAKRLQDQPIKDKPSQTEIVKHEKHLINNLLIEIGKELKELVKEEFINEVLEHAAFNALDSWWASQRQLEEESMVVESTSEDFEQNCKRSYSPVEEENADGRGPSSPIEPYPWAESGQSNNVDNEITSPDTKEKCKITATNDNPHKLEENLVPETIEQTNQSKDTVKDEDLSPESAAIVPDSTSECISQDNCIHSPGYTTLEEVKKTNEIEEKCEECVSSSVPESTSSGTHSGGKQCENVSQKEVPLGIGGLATDAQNEGELIPVDNSCETNVLEQSPNKELKPTTESICMIKKQTENKEKMLNENTIPNQRSCEADSDRSNRDDLKPESVNSSPNKRESINTVEKLKPDSKTISVDKKESVEDLKSTFEELKPTRLYEVSSDSELESVENKMSPRGNFDEERFKSAGNLSFRPTVQTIPALPVIDTSGLMDKVAFANRRRRLINVEPLTAKTDEMKPTTSKLEDPSSLTEVLPETQIPIKEQVQNPSKVEDATDKIP